MPHPLPIPLRELVSLCRLALPLAFANAGQALMGLVDTAICGRAGAAVLAGVGLGNGLFFSLAVFGMGIMMGLDPLISQAVGAGDTHRARHLLRQGTWLAIGAGLLLALPGALVPSALRPLGIEDEVARQASAFIWIRLVSLPGILSFVATRAYLQALGHTRAILLSTVLANAVNLAAALLFVFGGSALPEWVGPLRLVPAMGAAGCALATVLVTYVQALVLALAAHQVDMPVGGESPRRPFAGEIARAVRIGLPVGLHMAAEVGVFSLAGFLAGRLGRVPLASHQIAIAFVSTTFTFAVGIGTAGSVQVGWAIGARDTSAARRAGFTAFLAGALVMTCSALLFFLAPGPLARAMTDDPAVQATTASLLGVAAVFQIADGIQGVGAGILRGAGDTRFTFGANMVGHWLVGLPVAVLLGVAGPFGVTGLWWGLCVGLVTVAVTLYSRFLRISSREIEPLAPGASRHAP